MSTQLTGILSSPQTQVQDPSQTPPATSQGTLPASNAPAEWLNSIPEQFRQDANIANHKNFEDLLADYNALKTNAGKPLEIPNWDSDYNQNKEFFTKVGVPETPDKYEVQVPDGWDLEKVPLDKDFVGEMQKIAHQHKIPAAAFKDFAAAYLTKEHAALSQSQLTAQQQYDERDQQLAERWGSDKDTRTEYAKKAWGQFADQSVSKELMDAGIATHPAFIHFVSEIGKAMQLPQSPGASSSSGSGVQSHMVTSPQQALDAIKAIQQDPDKSKALFDRKHPQHKYINDSMNALYKQAYGG